MLNIARYRLNKKTGKMIEYFPEKHRPKKWRLRFECLKCNFVSKVKNTHLSLGEEFALPVCLDCGGDLIAQILSVKPIWSKQAYAHELKEGYKIEKYVAQGKHARKKGEKRKRKGGKK